MAHKEVSILAIADMVKVRIQNTKTMQLHNLFMSQCMLGAMDEL